MNGPWHYKESERLLAEARGEPARHDESNPVAAIILAEALVHAVLANAAAATVCAFSEEDDPDRWARAFADDGPVETPEQSTAGGRS